MRLNRHSPLKLRYGQSESDLQAGLKLPVRYAFILNTIAFLSVFQLFAVSLFGIYLSLYVISALAITVIMTVAGQQSLDSTSRLFWSLIAISVISLLWSPDRILGVREIGYTVSFISLYQLARKSGIDGIERLHPAIAAFSLFALVNSVAIIVFRLYPEIESSFLASESAKIFINPNVLESYNLLFNNNVKDLAKSGGFFVNANVAAVFTELAFYAAMISSRYKTGLRWRLVGLMHLAAIVETGSKSAIIILVLLVPFLAVTLRIYQIPKSQSRAILILTAVLSFAALLTALYFLTVGTDFVDDTQLNSQRRNIIFTFAANEFLKSPILGQGFGGWAITFFSYGYNWRSMGLNESMPAHNLFIILWSQSGILAAVLALMIIVTLFKMMIGEFRAGTSAFVAGSLMAMLASVVIHSMGDNFSLFSEPHIQAPLAIMMGWVSTKAGLIRSPLPLSGALP